MPAILTENLTRRFGNFTAVDKVNIKVSKAAIGGYQGQPPVVEQTTNQ